MLDSLYENYGAVLPFIAFIWFGLCFVGAKLGEKRTIGQGGGVVLTLWLGIIGLIIICCFPYVEEECDDIPTIIEESNLDKLTKLNSLRNNGGITEEEYQDLKTNLLNKL